MTKTWHFDGLKIVNENGVNLATVNGSRTTEGIKNGKLMAAAPKMKEMLDILLRSHKSNGVLTIGHSVLCQYHVAQIQDILEGLEK